jgi:hypothetical protein
MTRHWLRRGTATTILAGLVLAGCGNRAGVQDEWTAVQTFLNTTTAQLQAQRSNGGGAHTSVVTGGTPEQVREVIAQVPGRLSSLIMLRNNESAVLLYAGANHGYERWATPSGQTLTFRDGVLTATRGFNFDLMSSSVDGTATLVRRRASGNVNRIYRYLDGEDNEVDYPARCSIAPQGAETVVLPTGARVATTKMGETCVAGERQIRNTYWVAGSGEVVKSQQWVSAEVGETVIQKLR